MLALQRSGDRVRVTVRLVPRASTSAISGERDGALLVRVTAPPVAGAANDALIAVLAKALDLAPTAIVIERGAAARTKVLSVPAAARARLERVVK